MLWQHCNWLLTFHQPGLESSFWLYPPVQNSLLAIDQLAAAVVVVNNVLIGIYLSSMAALRAADRSPLPEIYSRALNPGALWPRMEHAFWASVFVVPVLAANALLFARPAAYSRHRTRILFAHRLVRIAAIYLQQATLLGMDVPGSMLESAAASAAVARGIVLKTLALRPPVFLWMHCCLFPVAFRLQFLFQLATLPAAVALANVNVGILAQPQLAAATCTAYRQLRLFTLYYPDSYLPGQPAGHSSAASCPPFAAQYVSWFFAIIFGVVGPLVFAYVIEARHRLMFLSAASGTHLQSCSVQACLHAAAALFFAVHVVHFGISLCILPARL